MNKSTTSERAAWSKRYAEALRACSYSGLHVSHRASQSKTPQRGAGMTVIMDRCILRDYEGLRGSRSTLCRAVPPS